MIILYGNYLSYTDEKVIDTFWTGYAINYPYVCGNMCMCVHGALQVCPCIAHSGPGRGSAFTSTLNRIKQLLKMNRIKSQYMMCLTHDQS